MVNARIVYHDPTGKWFIEFSGDTEFVTDLYYSITEAIRAFKHALVEESTCAIIQVVLHSARPDTLPNYVNNLHNKKFGDSYVVYKGDIRSIF